MLEGKYTTLSSIDSSPLVFATAVSVLLATVGSMPSTPITLAILVAAVLVVGPAVAIGGAAGVLIYDLLRGAVGYWTATNAVWLLVFTGSVAWLVSTPLSGFTNRPSQTLRRAVFAYVGAISIGGTLATAAAAWVGFVLHGQRFYASLGFLTGIPVAAAAGISVLVLSDLRDRIETDHVTAAEASVRGPAGGRSGWVQRQVSFRVGISLLLTGLIWLGGGVGLDVLAHDLGVFRTEEALRRYVAGFVGAGSTIAPVATTVFVGVYRYGEWTLHLSGPIVAISIWVTCRRVQTRKDATHGA